MFQPGVMAGPQNAGPGGEADPRVALINQLMLQRMPYLPFNPTMGRGVANPVGHGFISAGHPGYLGPPQQVQPPQNNFGHPGYLGPPQQGGHGAPVSAGYGGGQSTTNFGRPYPGMPFR